MATIKSEYYRFNGVSWDLHYLKTTFDLVEGAKEYIASRGENLVTNGTGLLNSNYNFNGFTFDPTEAYGAAGSFKDSLTSTRFSDEYMPVDISKRYKMSFWAKQVKGNPTKDLTRHYSFLDMYDVDKKSISREMVWPFANTTTTLAQDLKIGDTVVYLTNAANYNNAAGSATHFRKFMFWGYKNSFGYEYPVGTYTRYYSAYNTWADGAVNYVSNTITLNAPWSYANPNTPDGKWPAGTYVSNGTSGGYTYKGLSNTQVPEIWTEYTGLFVPSDFRPGTAYIRLGWLNHYAAGQTTGTVDNNTIYYSNISFGFDLIFDGDTRLTNSRPASDVYSWAKAVNPPSALGVYRGFASALDTLFTPGFYYVSNTSTGQPNASNFGWLHVETQDNANYNGSSNWLRQTFQQTDGKKYYRYKVNASAWSSWQQEYSSQYKPSLADLGALVETNEKLLFGGTTQYIRLAYAGNTKAFIKHGADATEEELWHSGNFNPSNYLPLTQPVGGSILEGIITFNGQVYFNTNVDISSLYVDTITSDGGSIAFSGVDTVDFNQIDISGVRGLYSETDAFILSDENIPTLRCGPTGAGTFEVYGSIWTDGDITSKSRKVITEGPTAAKTANYTFVLGDANGFIYSNSASALTFTIPLNSSVAYPTGTEIHIMRYGTGEISISPTSGVTLVSEGSKRRINAQYQAASLKKLDTNTWVLIGALKT